MLAANARVSEDATLAILLTGFFSVGVILVSRRSSYTADLTAFLFGRILTVDRQQIVVTAVIGGVVLLTLALLGKELVLRAFDPDGAAALRLPGAGCWTSRSTWSSRWWWSPRSARSAPCW